MKRQTKQILRLASLFSDGAVLQREMPVPVWGIAEPNTMVRAELAGKSACTRSSSDGTFCLRLPGLPAGGPYNLKVRAGNETIEIKDVLIGEVWIAGGQSNMQFPLECQPAWVRWGHERVLVQRDEFLRTYKNPGPIRILTVPRVANGGEEHFFSASWLKLTPDNAPVFSAVAAWFAEALREKLHVPVGIISCNWGSSRIEAWTSRNGLRRNPDTLPVLNSLDELSRTEEYWERDPRKLAQSFFERCGAADPGNKGVKRGYAKIDFDDSDWDLMKVPGSWIKQKISGNGVVWVRFSVDLPAGWANRDLHLHLGEIDKCDITYFNGTRIGKSGEGFDTTAYGRKRCYSVPGKLVRKGKNVIAVRAYSFMYDGALNGTKDDYYLERGSDGAKIFFAGAYPVKSEFDAGVVQPFPDPGSYAPGNQRVPAILFDSMVRPLIPYAVRGVIWYQGESNTSSPADAEQYCAKMRTLIEDWRYWWGQGDFPFVQVELAGYREPRSFDSAAIWALLRESQNRVCTMVPRTGIVSAIDLGDEKNIHPTNKKDVGRRLAQYVLAECCQVPGMVPRGPRFRDMEISGGTVTLFFDFAEGLCCAGGTLKGFRLESAAGVVAEPDHAVIEKDRIVLRSERIPYPAGVWYSWSNHPDGNLYNGAGLPASPFRAGTALQH